MKNAELKEHLLAVSSNLTPEYLKKKKITLKSIVEGMKVEAEHDKGDKFDVVKDVKDLIKIALVHLHEDPKYYKKLASVESVVDEMEPQKPVVMNVILQDKNELNEPDLPHGVKDYGDNAEKFTNDKKKENVKVAKKRVAKKLSKKDAEVVADALDETEVVKEVKADVKPKRTPKKKVVVMEGQ